MSRYEWEAGTIVIPTNQWSAFKKSFREAYNKALEADLTLVKKLVEKVKADNKGKRGLDWSKALSAELSAMDDAGYRCGYHQGQRLRYSFQILEDYDIKEKVIQKEKVGEAPLKTKLTALKAKDFPLATTKTGHFSHEDASVSFDDSLHAVRWDVRDNNHAVERARDCFIGRTLFTLLGRVQWGRGSGGVVSGNDEYNRESQDCGDGANYATSRFGPLGARDADFDTVRAKARRAPQGPAKKEPAKK